MTVTSMLSNDKATVEIDIRGHFDFSVQKDFRDTYKDHASSVVNFRVNLSQVDYMDSAALGMLMVLKKHADTHAGRVVLKSPAAPIKKILLISKFDKLFTIEG